MSARRLVGVLLVALAGLASAETGYVGDRLQIGLHADKSLSSTILELLPTGTALEVLERDGDLVRVRSPGGARGWVDARYLSATEPGGARVAALETELASAQAALADAQARLAEAELRLRERVPPAGTAERGSDEAIPSDTLREMQALAEENQVLKQRVAELEALQRMSVERSRAVPAPAALATESPPTVTVTASVPEPAHPLNVLAWEAWQQILLASALLLAFAAGAWLVDWSVRRRHGGFRI